jgi:exodeoxyribonuclease V alpha subunit
VATPQPAPERENLAGLVERVTFHNEDSGFCVLRVKARDQRDLITVVGHAAAIGAGEFVQASGRWVNDRTHGVQFRADFLRAAPPTTAEGIEKYLASGMIKGIGPIYAKKPVRAFSEAVFDVIEQTPARLKEVDGIGPKRADSIVAAWADQKAIREIMIFLHSHGVGTSRAVRIFKTYGADAIRVISENPYRLARDIRGIGFKSADQIAGKLGIEKTAMIRAAPASAMLLRKPWTKGTADCRSPNSFRWRRRSSRSRPRSSRMRSTWSCRLARLLPTPSTASHAFSWRDYIVRNAPSPRVCGRLPRESFPGPPSMRSK